MNNNQNGINNNIPNLEDNQYNPNKMNNVNNSFYSNNNIQNQSNNMIQNPLPNNNYNVPNNPNNKEKNKKIITIIGIVIIAIIVIFIVSKLFGGNNSDIGTDGGIINNSKPVATLNIEELYNKMDEDIVEQYKGKKINIIGKFDSYHSEYEYILMRHNGVYISCNDIDSKTNSSLELNEGDTITVTGIVDSVWSTKYNWDLNECTVSK